MKQRRLNAYLKLIQELLTCPRGEEWIRLKQHEELVDSELVQIMEQIASQLLQEGNRQAAIFLHNWAAKLHHILVKETLPPKPADDKSQAYLSLIQNLLDCSEDERDTLLAEHRDLVGPGLVHTMQQVATQLKQQGSEAAAADLQNLATELNQAWIEAHAFRPDLQKDYSTNGSHPVAETPEPTTVSSAVADNPLPKPSSSRQPSAASLQVNQQLVDVMAEISQALHQLNRTIAAQTHTTNPLWYMDVLERAATAQWLLTTDEIEQLIGVKPKCHGRDKTYQRGTWTFVKVGKLGAQTAWKVTKTRDFPILDTSDRDIQPERRQANNLKPSASLAKHPPLKQTTNGAFEEIPEMEDVWA